MLFAVLKQTTDTKLITVEIYEIPGCYYCKNAIDDFSLLLTDKYGKFVEVEIINVEDGDGSKKYSKLINSIDEFGKEYENYFPLINIENYFVVCGYDYYFGEEIINDMRRLDAGMHLGVQLEDYRYVWR